MADQRSGSILSTTLEFILHVSRLDKAIDARMGTTRRFVEWCHFFDHPTDVVPRRVAPQDNLSWEKPKISVHLVYALAPDCA